jgi:bacteriocin biosynthesis cyclodehydratase domain-containing protein
VRALVCVGEPDRRLLDDWQEPHLVVRFVEGAGLVGPFVVPGSSTCVRCIEGHLADRDPAWPLLLEQYARHAGADRADGVPEPLDIALVAFCLALAARDLASWAEGATPARLGSTLTVGPSLDGHTVQKWPRRPDCACLTG